MKNNPAKNILFMLLSMFSAVSLLFSPIISAPASTYAIGSGIFPGDLNCDGAVNVLDLIWLKLILLGQFEPMKSPCCDENSDVDLNGIVNLIDNGALLDLIFGVIDSHGGGGGGGGGGGNPTPTPTPTTPAPTWYQDADGDGYGNPSVSTQSDTQPSGYVADNTDCNDSNAAVHPGAEETCNGIDDDCDGNIDEGFPDTDSDGIADCADTDDDGDGVADGSDCAPLDAGKWQLLSGYTDADGDGYGSGSSRNICSGASLPSGYVSVGGACDDSNAAMNPGAEEICNGIDDDCDGSIDEGLADTDSDGLADCVDSDDDGDGVADSSDCAPLDSSKWQLLSGYTDADGDGYGTGSSQDICSGASLPGGYASVGGDCNDSNAAVHPGATEIVNGIDDNCAGNVDVIDSSLHHLGDDDYSGSANSQFQMATEGTTYSRSFTVDMLQLYSTATLSITHRGVQRADPIRINGELINSMGNSPSDGSLGTSTISFDIHILKAGANTISITSSYDSWNHDYDDFEFTNIYITLSQ